MGINKFNRSGLTSQVEKQSDQIEGNKKQYCHELLKVALRGDAANLLI